MMNIFQKFGLKQVINGCGKMTVLGASAVDYEVAEAMGKAARDYVEIADLLVVAGKYIAKATGAEDGCPTCGASAGIAISTAAVIAGCNLTKIEALPNSEGMRNEIILQKGHAVNFGASVTQMIRIGGGKPIEVGCANLVEAAHIEEAITEKTAALFYIKSHHAVQKGMQSIKVMIDIAHKHHLPLLIDAAAEEDMNKYRKLGADLVIYSGGKALEGPTSGLICGRADLCKACRMQYGGIGRPMKIGKEGIIGLLTALERYGKQMENGAEQRERMQLLLDDLKGISGLEGRIVQDEAGREIYRAELTINENLLGLNATQIAQNLKIGDPVIYTRDYFLTQGKIYIDPRPLFEGQEKIIVEKIKKIIAEK
ncbi:L-seryl-tRNA(Ser) seleniumtransferase [Propionispira arboris]|uniref:L-seryl-tRNA(Ser) seleniumtransferase n=1 Tax=Propionispira arboris TaxID=84035 RepID=A0A1H7CGD9_9FIRM|nr:DgaE family pyridoxal phosphate-dependent ammonia lyase [Propionispira arboris]SEJ84725.1 L-seryl-tRNA(Ser) seleniumtransferase [Propionispira arboris]